MVSVRVRLFSVVLVVVVSAAPTTAAHIRRVAINITAGNLVHVAVAAVVAICTCNIEIDATRVSSLYVIMKEEKEEEEEEEAR